MSPESPVETTVPGLRKFDLGTIPASVTPPPSWRRAAWFAVGASLAVLMGLVFAAVTLVGRPKNTETIEALPGYPSLPLMLDSLGATPTNRPVSPKPGDHPDQSATSSPARRLTAPGLPAGTSAERPPNTSVTTPPVPPSTPPIRQTTPKRAFAMNDPKEIGDRTERFYDQVTANPGAAYAMTTGEIHLQGEEAFRQRYANIRRVEVRQISIDPNQGTTLSEVRIIKKDGTILLERRWLKFTPGKDPKISSEVTH
jgi:hypothetical protein